MWVEVRLYGILRRYHPGQDRASPFRVDLKDGQRVVDLAPCLGMPADWLRAVIVNGEVAEASRPLQEGDRVQVFPPVAGGAGARSPAQRSDLARFTPKGRIEA